MAAKPTDSKDDLAALIARLENDLNGGSLAEAVKIAKTEELADAQRRQVNRIKSANAQVDTIKRNSLKILRDLRAAAKTQGELLEKVDTAVTEFNESGDTSTLGEALVKLGFSFSV